MKRISHKTRFGQIPGYIGATLFVAGSAYLNARFGYGLGGNLPESVTYSGLSIASDLLKATAPLAAVAAWHNRDYLRTGVAVVFVPLAVTYSLVSASGFAAETRSNRAGDNLGQQQAFDRASASHKSAASEIARIVDHTRWKSTAACGDATVPKSIAFCEINKPMYQAAVAKIAVAETVMAKGRPQQADAQSAMLAKLTGIDEQRVSALIGGLLALLIELGSTFGFLIASGGRSKPRPAPKTAKTANHAAPTLPRPSASKMTRNQALDMVTQKGTIEGSLNQIADSFGVSRTSVSSWLKSWESDELIALEKDGQTRRILALA